MTLPRAVASGPAASGPGTSAPDAVRPLRTAIFAGVLAAVYLLVLFVAEPVPTRLVALFGGAASDIERHGGLEMVWLPPDGVSVDELAARARDEGSVYVSRSNDGLVIRVPEVRREDVAETAKRLAGDQKLAFHRVLRVDEMRQLADVLGLPMRGQKPVDLELDDWSPAGGARRTDYYLIADTCEAIDAALAEARGKGWALPAGTRIALEPFDMPVRACRSYVIDEAPALGGEHVANAVKSYDPNTNRPIVLLDFDEEGGKRLGELTARIVGEKLAIMVGGDVRSAPVINDPIYGGRASITMGSSDPWQQEREAELLVNTLRVGALPSGGTVVDARYIEPVDDAGARWLARLMIALGGGVLIALLVWVVIRVTRPVRRPAISRSEGPRPWRRAFVTLLAPVAVFAVSQITALGVLTDELLYQFGGTSYGETYERILEQVSFGALGIGPVISAFVFVEVLALIVPGWRRRRHAGPTARAPLTAAVAITAATLLVLQSWFVTEYLYSLGTLGVDVLPFGMKARLLVIGSFAIGTLVLVGVAALIREHGLGNGYGALLAAGWLIGVVKTWLAGPALDGDVVIGGLTVLAIAIPLALVARWRIARLGEAPVRLPSSGITPLAEVGGLAVLVALLSKFPLENVTLQLHEWSLAARTNEWLLIALLAVMTIVWSFAFARPAVTRKLAERTGLVAPARSTWWAATLLSGSLLLFVGAIAWVTLVVRPTAWWLVDALSIATVTMVVLDMHADWRTRRTTLERVWSLHQAQHAELVARALDEAQIPHHLSATHLKTLLAFFGPFAPIDVLVPPEHAPAARARLRELFE